MHINYRGTPVTNSTLANASSVDTASAVLEKIDQDEGNLLTTSAEKDHPLAHRPGTAYLVTKLSLRGKNMKRCSLLKMPLCIPKIRCGLRMPFNISKMKCI